MRVQDLTLPARPATTASTPRRQTTPPAVPARASGATHYELSEQVGSAGWSVVQDTSATSWNAVGKTDGSYGYKVRVCAGTGTGNCSGYTTAKTIAVTVPPLSITRTYTYNSYQQLCRVVEPEVGPSGSTEGGATLMGYDGAGNLAWSASGLVNFPVKQTFRK